MSAQLYALGRWCFRNRWKVIGFWLALLVLLGTSGALLMGDFDDEFRIPGSSSQEALDNLRMTFPEGAALGASAVIIAADGTDVNDLQTVVEANLGEFEDVEVLDSVMSPWNDYIDGLVSEDGEAAVIQMFLDIEGNPTTEQLASITDAADRLEEQLPAGATVSMGGQAYNVELPSLTIIEAAGLGSR